MIDRRSLRYFDWISFSLILTLLSIGLLFVFSTTTKDSVTFSLFFKKQLFGAATGILIYFFCSFFSLDDLCRLSFFGYFILLGLLLYTILGGWVGMGAKRWISLYIINFQPSELVKIGLPLCLAFYFGELEPVKSNNFVKRFSPFIFPIVIIFLSFLLILKQPDLGTALIILFSGIVILWITNIPKIFFIVSIAALLVGAPIIWKNLEPYQQHRILVLLGHGDNKNERYQIEQSKIAIGSGGLWGKGLMKGTQNRFSFLPEARTDFIFSVLCEELGFAGAFFILLLFSLLFMRLCFVIIDSKKLIDQLVGIGVLSPIVFSTLINLGMVSGLLPTVGIPLPLFTYGVTSLWVTCAGLGLLNNVSIRRSRGYSGPFAVFRKTQ